MKIFIGSLTDFSIEVDAWVPTHEQGLILLRALADYHKGHVLVMRARLQRFMNYEERYIGPPHGDDFDAFMGRVELMGHDDKIKGEMR